MGQEPWGKEEEEEEGGGKGKIEYLRQTSLTPRPQLHQGEWGGEGEGGGGEIE